MFSKSNFDGVARGKHDQTRIGGVVHDSEVMVVLFFRIHGVMESNKMELLAIRRAIYLWARYGYGNLITKGDFVNVIA